MTTTSNGQDELDEILTEFALDVLQTGNLDKYGGPATRDQQLAVQNKAKAALQAYHTRECARKVLEGQAAELAQVKLNMKDVEPPRHYRADLALDYIAHRQAELRAAIQEMEGKP